MQITIVNNNGKQITMDVSELRAVDGVPYDGGPLRDVMMDVNDRLERIEQSMGIENVERIVE